MARQLIALADLPQDQGSVPSTHTRQLTTVYKVQMGVPRECPMCASDLCGTHTICNTQLYLIKNNRKKSLKKKKNSQNKTNINKNKY